MKHLINREKLTLVISMVLVIAVLISATVAWFMVGHPASLRNLEINLDDKGDLSVWVKVEEDIAGADMDYTDEDLRKQHFLPLNKVGLKGNVKYTMDMNIVEQDNIEENTLAPGAYGKVEFKILTKTELTTGYTLTITPELMVINKGFETNNAGLTKDELFNLVKTHIKFYTVNESGKYSKVIPYYDEDKDITLCSISDNLEKDVIKDVVLYWYWPYEYTDIPDLYNTSSPVYDEYSKYRNAGTESERIELYDWDDTYIGNYVEKLRYHFDIKGNR